MWAVDRTIFHIDVNSAFLSWTAADLLSKGEKNDIREIPSVIGGDEKIRHGIVLAKSEPAKKLNIKTGEPLYFARQKCRNLLVLPPNFEVYNKSSNDMLELLENYSPSIEQFSIDECFLDYTGMDNFFGKPLEAAHKIRNEIKKKLGFTVNIGISSNKILAKMASDFEKPNKVHTLYPNEIKEKMWNLPIEDLYMVGKKTAPKLRAKGIYTIGDLACYDLKLLQYYYKSHGNVMWQFANGIDNSPINTLPPPAKGMSASTTTPQDVATIDEINTVLLGLCEQVSSRLRKHDFCARRVGISLRTSEFENHSHQAKIKTPTNCTNELYRIACRLIDEAWSGQHLRNIGVHTSELSKESFYQYSIWDCVQNEKEMKLDAAVDKIRKIHGEKSLKRGSLI